MAGATCACQPPSCCCARRATVGIATAAKPSMRSAPCCARERWSNEKVSFSSLTTITAASSSWERSNVSPSAVATSEPESVARRLTRVCVTSHVWTASSGCCEVTASGGTRKEIVSGATIKYDGIGGRWIRSSASVTRSTIDGASAGRTIALKPRGSACADLKPRSNREVRTSPLGVCAATSAAKVSFESTTASVAL
jgi:hypothetical protein